MSVTVKQIINALGGLEKTAHLTNSNYMTVAAWSHRNRIPAMIQLNFQKIIKRGIKLAEQNASTHGHQVAP